LVRALDVLSTLVPTIIWWTPNYPKHRPVVQNGPRELLTIEIISASPHSLGREAPYAWVNDSAEGVEIRF
jgi:hypothetical protein